MTCALTIKQQRSLLKKVAADLDDLQGFDFNIYAKGFYDLVQNKTNDPVLAANYVGLLPTNIWAIMGVNKQVRRKLATVAGELTGLERQFEDFARVQDFVNGFATSAQATEQLEKDLKKDSQTRPPQQAVIDEPEVITPVEPVSLSDLPVDNVEDQPTVANPKMRIYTDIKAQMIANRKEDGSSVVNGTPVRIQIVSTADFQMGDLFPTTQEKMSRSEDARKRIEKANSIGIALVVTNLDGKILRFNEELKVDEDGKMIYYLLRNPENMSSDAIKNDQIAIEAFAKDRQISKEEAAVVYKKKLDLIRKIREYINENPKQHKIKVNIAPSVISYQAKISKSTTRVGDLKMGEFTPYKGVSANGQLSNVYYFNVPGTNITIPINGQTMPQDLVHKLVQLMTEEVSIKSGSNTFQYKMGERIKLFNQFVYFDPDVFGMSVAKDGSLVIKKMGVVQNYADKSELAADLTKMLTLRKGIIRSLTEERANELFKARKANRVEAGNLQNAGYNDVYTEWQPDNSAKYYQVGDVQMKINDTAFKNNSYRDFTITDGVIKVDVKPYYSFIQQNFLIPYTVDSSGQLQSVGSYLNFEVAPEDLVKMIKVNRAAIQPTLFDDQGNMRPEVIKEQPKPEERPQTAKEKFLALRKNNPKKFNKIIAQKGLQATLDQIDAAEKWYNNHPLSAYFPFEALFDKVNQEDSNSIATWTMNGITLFKGADYTDLYHEAWHGFTQGLMSVDQKKTLYSQVRKKTGTFKDYFGNTVEFSKASDLQIEEHLAEGFRQYVLSNGKSLSENTPATNSFFRKVLNFLRELFGLSTVRDSVDGQVNTTIADLYNKLRIGDISEYIFAQENANFNTLNKTMTAIDNGEEIKSLSFEDSNLIFQTMESLFSEGVDEWNRANVDDIDERRALQAKTDLTGEEKARLKELNTQITSSYTTVQYGIQDGLKNLYSYGKWALEDRLADFITANDTAPSFDLQKKIDLLRWALRNFGDINNIHLNRSDEGVIGYHLWKSNLIEQDVLDDIQDNQDLAEREIYGKEFYDRGGNERSIFDLAGREIKNLIKSLNKTDVNGVVLNNRLGFSQLVGFKETFAYIARTIQNSKDITEMYNRLRKESDIYQPIKQLLFKLGPLSYKGQTDKEVDLWTRFYQTFNKYRVPLIQTTIDETQNNDKDGNPLPSTFEIKIGMALADYKKIDLEWKSEFKKSSSAALVKNDKKGNYLDLPALFEKYPTVKKVNEDPMTFLRDIGIGLKDIGVIKSELESEIRKGNIRLSGIYSNLKILNEKGVFIREMWQFLNHSPKLGIEGQTGPNSNYGKILQLQSRYSGDYSDFMVKNAAGDPQSEYMQNNSLTQEVKQINSVRSYNELVANAPTAHYNNAQNVPGRPYNPWVSRSVWIRSLFNFDTLGGLRYEGNDIQVDNLSGVNSSINETVFEQGIALAQADEVGKLLNDFHMQLMKFTPELTRHAGKKTSLAAYLRNYRTGSKNPRLYVDTENFVTTPGEFNKGFDDYFQIVKQYIAGELDRINYAKTQLEEGSGVEEADFNYLKRATKFVAFAGVLSEETKNELYKVDGDLLEHLETNPELAEKVYDEVQAYFNGLVDGVEKKLREVSFISPNLINKVRYDAKVGEDVDVTRALTSSFVANNWIQHFEEMIMFYGDIAQYKDFFKRNASLNSTGDIIRNDAAFVAYVNEHLGKPFAQKIGADTSWNGVMNVAVSADVLTKSVYLQEYQKAVGLPVIDQKYGEKGINEADAQGMIVFDSYRIISKALGKWSQAQEDAFQDILAGKPLSQLDVKEFFPVLKMGYFGPIQAEGLPMTALHKFALMPLIPGLSSNLDALHNKMMKEGIDYHTFESGSKVATVTNRSGLNQFYSDLNKRELNINPWVKNRVFVEYLKYQVEANPKYKTKMTLPTQFRKLADLGLIDKGLPTDWSGSRHDWRAMTKTQRRQASPNYDLRQKYIRSLRELVEYKKNELLSDIGWKRDKDGNLVGKMDTMLKLISSELKRSDVGEHEWMYIQTIKDQIKNKLDTSMSAEVIEKVIVSLVNKRLVNIKVRGEQFVMVSTTGFENKAFAYGTDRNFEKPTDEDKAKYGTNDLPTYHIRNGKIAAAKVKIAIQGDFEKLLDHPDVKQKAKQLRISNFDALNLLLKDDTWLDQEDHRQMISMIGARIPTQGPNSSDFVEVYEFLPKIAGNIIIAPSEVTSKAGSDNDYDKLPLMMPHIFKRGDSVELARKYNIDQARELYNELIKSNIKKLTLQGLSGEERRMLFHSRFAQAEAALIKMLGPDYYDDLVEIVQEDVLGDFDTFFEKLNGAAVLENNIQQNLRNILERESNFSALIRPNDTDTVKPLADAIRGNNAKEKEGTRMFEVLQNLAVQQSNSVGKDTLGIGAKANTMSAVFQALGVTLQPEFLDEFDKPYRAVLLFKHNQDEDENISLSSQMDALNENNIAEVISQLINGWVDVEKDDWISYIQGNKQVAPIMLFMVRAGVPIRDIVHFVTQPVIKKYVAEQKLAKSGFSKVLGLGNGRRYKKVARDKMLATFGLVGLKDADVFRLAEIYTEGIKDFADLKPGAHINNDIQEEAPKEVFADAQALEAKVKIGISTEQFKNSINNLFDKAGSEKELKFLHKKFSLLTHPDKGGRLELSQELNDAYDKHKGITNTGGKVKAETPERDFNLAMFLHYLEIENMANQVARAERAFDVDTTTLENMTEFFGKIKEIEKLSKKGFIIPNEFIEEMIDNSPIGPFYIQGFALELFGRVFPLRNKQVLNEFLNNIQPSDLNNLWNIRDEDERMNFYRTFKNDLIYDLYQQQLRAFSPATTSYRNQKIEFNLQDVKMKFGAVVKDGKLYVSKDQLENEYRSRAYAKEGYGLGELATFKEFYPFANFDEYKHFVYERETLRSLSPAQDVIDTLEYQPYLEDMQARAETRLQDETDEDFDKRVKNLAYEEFLRDRALYNIFNPYQLFKAQHNVAARYNQLMVRYPQLSSHFTVLNNIRQSSKEGFTNLQPSTTQWEADEINIFYENLQDLANSNKLLEVQGLNQDDADFISKFFKMFPLYMFMQSGPNTKSQFSFARMLPDQRIQRLMEKPVEDLTKNLDEKYLQNFLNRFILANARKDLRNRFKEFSERDNPELFKKPYFNEEKLRELGSFRGVKINFGQIQTTKDKPVAARRNPDGTITLDLDLLKVKFDEKAWTVPARQSDGTYAQELPENAFATFDQFLTFVLIHETTHNKVRPEQGENRGMYEDRINEIALEDVRNNYKPMQLNLFTEPTFAAKTEIVKSEQYSKQRFDAALSTANTFMSNFHQLNKPIIDSQGNEYWNSEGYYMSLRTDDLQVKKQIAEDSKQGGKASRAARRNYTLEKDGNKRAAYMLDVVRKKFQANPDLATQLIATGNQEIIEKNYWKDDLFGVRDDSLQGANVLGKVLMEVRSELQGKTAPVVQPAKTLSNEEVIDAINKCRI